MRELEDWLDLGIWTLLRNWEGGGGGGGGEECMTIIV